jgi:nucleotide-binding universal stress UspA family protein
MHVRTILHPTDHSDSSRAALRYAVALAHDYGARLLILHVLPNFVTDVLVNDPNSVGAETPRPGRASIEYLLGEGDPVTTVLKTAVQRQCDLIVMGRDGGRGWQDWFGGGRAERIVRQAPCPVLVVKEAMTPNAEPGPATPAGPTAAALPAPAGR